MARRKRKLGIIYSGEPGRINTDLDEALERCLAKFGYHRWASGWSFIENERDLAFEVR